MLNLFMTESNENKMIMQKCFFSGLNIFIIICNNGQQCAGPRAYTQ